MLFRSGQSYEVNVAAGPIRDAADVKALAEKFHEAHLRRYGHKATQEAIEIVNHKVTGVGLIPKPEVRAVAKRADAKASPVETRRAFFGKAGWLETPVYRRADLPAGARVNGPAIIEEKTSTTVLYPGQSGEVDEYLNIEIALQ